MTHARQAPGSDAVPARGPGGLRPAMGPLRSPEEPPPPLLSLLRVWGDARAVLLQQLAEDGAWAARARLLAGGEPVEVRNCLVEDPGLPADRLGLD